MRLAGAVFANQKGFPANRSKNRAKKSVIHAPIKKLRVRLAGGSDVR